jgi:hypothetical protein
MGYESFRRDDWRMNGSVPNRWLIVTPVPLEGVEFSRAGERTTIVKVINYQRSGAFAATQRQRPISHTAAQGWL